MVRNRSFTVPQSVVGMYQLEEYARPMVGRSVQVNSLCFTKRDWKANVASEAKAHLLVFPSDAKENGNEGVKAYLESGEAADIDKGYKTSIRDQYKNDLRLVFEIERVGQLFDDYKKVKLEIWRTFTDTTMEGIADL